MLTDKEQKKEFKKEAGADPDKFYATEVLKNEGFQRKQCKCGMNFWTVNDQDHCGDPVCSGGFTFYDKNPSKKSLTFTQVWKEFEKTFTDLGYRSVRRYPVIARWNPTADFTMASIAAFQPYVISGEAEPPAPKLIIPQFCLRFGDVDNVGITGAHCTGFVMIGQHAFVAPEDWSQERFFQEIYDYITVSIGLPKEELTLHEDAWAGGGNFGPCMEFFSRGMELFNQVYMMYEQTEEGPRELDIKVLDMGLGMERLAWFSQGVNTIYDATFPAVIKKLLERTGAKMDDKLFKKFAPHSAFLNIDEVDDINKAWADVAKKVGIDADALREAILPITAIYSIAEHTRALLVAISDGGLPSNVGGGYNLRVILRRALSFIDRFGWDIKLKEVAEWHAEELKEVFPELGDNLENVSKILDVETEKYEQSKEKAKHIVERLLKRKDDITTDELIDLYDSHGISPDVIQREAKKAERLVVVPDDFYKLVAERHEGKQQVTATKKGVDLDIKDDLLHTQALYFGDYSIIEFDGKVLQTLENDGKKFIVLDRTVFYPTSGGQLHDTGTITAGDASLKVVNVFKQGPFIVHTVEGDLASFKDGASAHGVVDFDRRVQLAQHHTATHIINGAAKSVLGSHVFQAGAAKTMEKSRIDITHYEALSKEQLDKIEDVANDIIKRNLPVDKRFVPRRLAEAEYGQTTLYQGGAVPGREVRIVNITGFDIEACGGTHLNLTSEAKLIKILKSSKVQDGVVRIEFVAGKAAKSADAALDATIEEVAEILSVEVAQVPARAEELFSKWKKARKAVKKKKELDPKELELTSTDAFKGTHDDILVKTSEVLQTQKEHIPKTVQRFLKELEEMKGKLTQ